MRGVAAPAVERNRLSGRPASVQTVTFARSAGLDEASTHETPMGTVAHHDRRPPGREVSARSRPEEVADLGTAWPTRVKSNCYCGRSDASSRTRLQVPCEELRLCLRRLHESCSNRAWIKLRVERIEARPANQSIGQL